MATEADDGTEEVPVMKNGVTHDDKAKDTPADEVTSEWPKQSGHLLLSFSWRQAYFSRSRSPASKLHICSYSTLMEMRSSHYG